MTSAELFFTEMLRHDLSLTNFLASDFTMLNGRLAKHYGIPGIEGTEMRRVALPPGSHRGGVLTHAAVLAGTSNGLEGHPVKRGMWLIKNLLDEPPPPPPEVNRTPWRQLQLGISRDQVKSLLGEPATVSVIGESFEYWYYDKNKQWKAYVRFNKKGVSGWTEP